MAAQFLGQVSVAGEFPPVSEALLSLANALQTANTKLAEFITLLEEAKNAIRPPAIAALQVQLDAALDFQAGFGLQISDPAQFVQDLLAGIAQLEQDIAELGPPSVALGVELGASLAVSAGLELQIAAIDAQLALLDAIAELIAFLRDSIQPAITAYAALATNLAVAGCYSFAAQSTLALLGTELAAVLPDSGVPPGVGVVAVVLLAPDTNVAAQAAIRATFKIAP